MKITFINPPQTDSKYKFMGVVAPPLGISYMAAVLENHDFDVNILDALALDMTWKDLENSIRKISPDIIAITALTPTINQAMKTAEIAKNTCPQSIIVMGGYHPTFNYERILETGQVDVVIRGEGEYTMLELAETLNKGGDISKVKGIAFDKTVTPTRPYIKDLDSLPFPARHLLPMDHYKLFNMDTKMATIVSSRGCPMQCSFCASASLHGDKMRLRSVTNVVDEMEHLVNEHNVETIAFMDDTFTLNKRRVEEICNEIKNRELKVFWGCTARVDSLSSDILRKMRESGCIAIFMGVESADQQILDDINKKTDLNKIINAFQISRKEKIRTIASVVLGMPGDNKNSIQKTVKFVKKLKPSYAIFSLATPYPGTRFYQETFDKNLIKVKDWSKYTLITPVLETMELSLDELKKLRNKAFINFYLRPGYILRQALMDGSMFLKTITSVIKKSLT